MVPVEGIEPPLLAEHDFEFVRVYQFRHTGLVHDPEKRVPGRSRFSDNIMRQEAPLYIRALAASMRRP